MAKKKSGGLGRGLSALIPQEDVDGVFSENEERDIKHIDINLIRANTNQPRKQFDKEKINELASSIKEHGIIQPLLVVKKDDDYIIVAGERRYRAAIVAGLKEIPVIVKEYSEKEISEVALIENLQREDLNEIEKAVAYNELKESFNMTQEDIAKRLGTSRASIANTLRLLSLSEIVKDAIRNNLISAGHARAILSVEEEYREEFLELIISKKLSVRESEKLAKEFKGKEKEKPIKKEKKENPYIKDLENRLSFTFGTKVKLKDNGNNKGSIVIDYYSNDDLSRLLELFKIEEK
ncbi:MULTISPECIES: ParB/RepB/Spo0J family partition protein [Anaerofustis]|uniref:ParB/RepB/Spo0J family partition protein n=1 Tax=Anaerofustis TaxID=264995 RepID=UPI001105B4BE|nr:MULTISPECIES: ParB/RepB/Spo0J family partition protein [Anaerofustis]MCO8193527.1 ParB/RepB/Spo0J family partition protein [Anaerofustis sp. NSJ-163]